MSGQDKPQALPRDDIIMAFEVAALGVRGRIVRLGPVVDEIICRHDYPRPVSALLAEAVALTAMLGDTLKFDGKLTFQTQTDGPVSLLVADYTTPGHVRGYAHYDKGFDYDGRQTDNLAALLGHGHLGLTIDQGAHMDSYQGIVSLTGQSLAKAGDDYFRQSEQLPTALRAAAGELASKSGKAWRSGAIMVQHLPREGKVSAIAHTSGDAPQGHDDSFSEDDNWTKARLLLETVEDHELLDPSLTPEQLLYRLYHEDGVKVYPPRVIEHRCTCTGSKVKRMLAGFSQQQVEDMTIDGKITVTCQFCSASYTFSPGEPCQ